MILLFFAMAFAQIPNELLVSNPAQMAVVNEVVSFKPVSGHHFNLKAPQLCASKDPLEKTATEVKCQFSNPGEQKVLLNVCDDKESFCKPERLTVKVTAPKGFKGGIIKSARENMVYTPKGERPAPTGFLNNDPRGALAQAKTRNKLLLINFSAHWCSYCNMLDEFVFEDQQFIDKSKNFVKVKLDGDSDISWEWKDKFRIGGYPTLVIANSNLDEVLRIAGYRKLPVIIEQLTQVELLKNEPMSVAEQKIHDYETAPSESNSAGIDQKRLRVGEYYFERAEWEKAIFYLEKVSDAKAQKLKLGAQMKLAQKADNKTEMLGLLEQLLTQFPNAVEFSTWASDLAVADKEKGKKYEAQVEQSVKAWVANPELDKVDYTVGDLYQVLAHYFETIGQNDKARASYASCSNYYEPLTAQSKLKVARGANLERAYCLLKSGNSAAAKDLYKTMAKQYHGEFAFSYNYAYALFDLSEFNEAYKHVRLAFQNAYGDNLMRAALLKAKIEMKLDKKAIAQTTLRETLAKLILPSSTQMRSHRYFGQLKDMLTDLEKK